jgi:hypothetical protein
MRREVGAINSSHRADDLLRREAPVADYHEVACDGFRINAPKFAHDVAPTQHERPARDPDVDD